MEFKEVYQELFALKADHLKIILTGLVDFNEFGKVDGIAFRFEELSYMTQSAKEHGLPVMVHANTAQAV
jgi:imidazolonepropionase-like amidohydrolase